MPVVLLGAAVSLGVVAVTASRFAWRRTKSESPGNETTDTENDTAPRFKPAPPRDPDAPHWDSPPPSLQPAHAPDPPSP